MPTPPPWWNADPRRAAGGVEQRVEDRPVGDGVGAVAHRLGLAVGRGDRAGVEVVAADDDGRLDLAAPHQLVEGAGPPWRARRSRASRCAPAAPGTGRARRAMRIQRASASSSGNSSQDRLVGAAMSLGIAGERHPAERPLALAEERADVRRARSRGCRSASVDAGVAAPGRAGCCRSRRRPRRASSARASRARARAIDAQRARARTRAGRAGAARAASSSVMPAGT